MLKEFRPTILFLAKFIGIYFVANLIYGFWITSYYPHPDPMTTWITKQSAQVLDWSGFPTVTGDHEVKPTTYIAFEGRRIVSVYEGCNGINVIVIFLSFLFAFGPINWSFVWFSGLGLLLIYLVNILRIVFLFLITMRLPQYFYFVHKYLFTASIYVLVFALWIWWIRSFSKAKTP